MSDLSELLETYEFLPNEFKRHLYLIRELEERQKNFIQQRDNIRKRLQTKQILEDEAERKILQKQYEDVCVDIDAFYEEKISLSQKLYAMQQKFIKELDQKIDKTEEDKSIFDKYNDTNMEDGDLTLQQAKNLQNKSKHSKQNARSAGGQFVANMAKGGGGDMMIGNNYGNLENASFMGVSQVIGGNKRQKDQSSMKIDLPLGGGINNKRRDRGEKSKIKQALNQGSDIIPGIGRNKGIINNSQDDFMPDPTVKGEDDQASCPICNSHQPQEDWILCDNCDLWYHFGCVGINPIDVPDKFYCPRCINKSGRNKLQRGESSMATDFGGGSFLDDN